MHIPIEVGPFADHTVHFRVKDADRLFDSLPIERLQRAVDIEETLSAARQTPSRHLGDRLKRIFFKNATFTFIGRRLS